MNAFRMLLALIFVTLVVYTAAVVGNHGMGLLTVFFGDMAEFGWPGQFNLDFMFMLALSATWVAWRHRFSAPGLVLATLAFFWWCALSQRLSVHRVLQGARRRSSPFGGRTKRLDLMRGPEGLALNRCLARCALHFGGDLGDGCPGAMVFLRWSAIRPVSIRTR